MEPIFFDNVFLELLSVWALVIALSLLFLAVILGILQIAELIEVRRDKNRKN